MPPWGTKPVQLRSDECAVVVTAPIDRNGKPTINLGDFAALVNDAPRNSIDVAVMASDSQTMVEGLHEVGMVLVTAASRP